MALAAATHHSAQPRAKEGVEGETNDAPRRPKPPLPGTRPEPLEEVSEPQVRAATVGYVAAAGAPLLAVPSLGGGDAIDDTSVHFLLEMALLSPEEVEQLRRAERRKLAREKEEKELEEKREKERQKAKVKETIARLTAEFFRVHSQASSSAQRKRKKRKKKKLPRGGHAHCRHRLWHVRAPHAVFPSFGGRPRCLAFWWPRSSLTRFV